MANPPWSAPSATIFGAADGAGADAFRFASASTRLTTCCTSKRISSSLRVTGIYLEAYE